MTKSIATGDTDSDTAYLISHGIPELMESCLAQVLTDKPDRPLETLIEKLTEKEREVDQDRVSSVLGKWEVIGTDKDSKKVYNFKSKTELVLETYAGGDTPSEVLQCSCEIDTYTTPWRAKVTMLKYNQEILCILEVKDNKLLFESGVAEYPSGFTKKKTEFKKLT
eukprot:TRINITY_DN11116_c0_g1_i1.p1 TRINITY_DN11116_c0_g1~~TRINITY_DN11116_c0_g1_i1.p1  ORF type:complete len:180 (+),score=29.04 TRINITY_DN11116_c0_g1_i1:45-542(+)